MIAAVAIVNQQKGYNKNTQNHPNIHANPVINSRINKFIAPGSDSHLKAA